MYVHALPFHHSPLQVAGKTVVAHTNTHKPRYVQKSSQVGRDLGVSEKVRFHPTV